MNTVALKLHKTARVTTRAAIQARRRVSLRRWLAHRWDLIAVLGLLAACTAYAICTLSDLG